MTPDTTPRIDPPAIEVGRDEFFIGYDPPLPPHLSRFVRRVVLSGLGGVVLAAALLAAGHTPLTGGRFEFGRPQSVSGTIVERPYPALIPDSADHERWLLLAAPGKHGADALVQGLSGKRVTLEGTRIERDAFAMLEVTPGSIASHQRGADGGMIDALADGTTAPARATLRGEIVDSKCFLGVMLPGSGKTHKECASLCVRGGLPPALFVRDRQGRSALLLLEDLRGESVAERAADLVGEPVEVSGVTGRRGGWLTIRSDPTTWRRLGGPPAR